MKVKNFSFAALFLLFVAASCSENPAPAEPAATEPTTLETIFSRKSVRSYTDEPVAEEQVETLLRAAMAAPTGMNVQPWRFVVVTDQAMKEQIAGRNGMIAKAPVVIVVCGETVWRHRPFGEPDADMVEDEDPNWTADCAAATENLLLAAEHMGLGAVWTACYPYEERVSVVATALGLPGKVQPYCVVPVGHPDGDPQPKDKWKPENIHYNHW